MNTRRLSAPNPLLFAVLAGAMVAMTLLLPKIGYVSSNRSVTAMGELLGFTVELPLYFWFFVLRRKGSSPLYAASWSISQRSFWRSSNDVSLEGDEQDLRCPRCGQGRPGPLGNLCSVNGGD